MDPILGLITATLRIPPPHLTKPVEVTPFFEVGPEGFLMTTPSGGRSHYAPDAGLSLAMACDFRIVGRSAKLTTAFAKVGLSGDFGGTWFLTQLVGTAKARELYLTSPVLTAQQALDIAKDQGRFTIFALVDALTRLAGQIPNAGDRNEADSKAASLLALAV